MRNVQGILELGVQLVRVCVQKSPLFDINCTFPAECVSLPATWSSGISQINARRTQGHQTLGVKSNSVCVCLSVCVCFLECPSTCEKKTPTHRKATVACCALILDKNLILFLLCLFSFRSFDLSVCVSVCVLANKSACVVWVAPGCCKNAIMIVLWSPLCLV